MVHLVSERIIVEQRLTRKRYTWWRYQLNDGMILVDKLKDESIPLESLLFALIRDIPFCKKYTNKAYKITDKCDVYRYQIKGSESRYFYGVMQPHTTESVNILSTINDEKSGEQKLLLPIRVSIYHLLNILHLEFPEIIKKRETEEGYYFDIQLHNADSNQMYKNNFMNLYKRITHMNSIHDVKYVMGKHFCGFPKNSKKLKLYAYEQCYDWNKYTGDDNITYGQKIKNKFGKNLKKFFILYFTDNMIFPLELCKDDIKYIRKIYDKNDCLF